MIISIIITINPEREDLYPIAIEQQEKLQTQTLKGY